MPFRRGFRRARGARRTPSRKVWGGWTTRSAVNGSLQTGLLANNTFEANWLLSPDDALDFYDEPTVIRLLLGFSAFAAEDSGSDNTDEWYQTLFAGIWVTRADEETGEPPFINLQDATHDYLWWTCIQFGHQPNDILRFNSANIKEDLRAKRKVPEGFGVAMQIFSADETAAAGDRLEDIAWVTTGRMLMIDH